jgi:flagellar biosynthesis protein FlhB
LNTERIQLKYEGWRRYFGLYNFFDLFSVILPLVMASLRLYTAFKVLFDFDEESQEQIEEIIRDVRIYTILNSFAILVMWLELLLVSFLNEYLNIHSVQIF